MKPTKLFATILVAAGTLFLFSCNSGDKTTGETTDDSTSTKVDTPATPPPVPPGPTSMVVVKHKVANYAKWKSVYDSDDSARLANGLHNYVIARGTEDTNMVLIAMRMDDVAKAKEFAGSKALKDKMKKGGVTGAPDIDYVHAVLSDTSAIQAPVRVLVKHKVKDWDAWKKVFDSHKQARVDAGLVDRVVGYSVDDNKNVSIVFAITDEAKANAFMKSDDLKNKMAEAGVVGKPTFFFYTIAARY